VIDAERAFAARAAEAGVARSFLDFMTDDAIVFAPGAVNAKAFYGARPPGKTPKEGGPLLAWWPNFAGISQSGDLGFTTGPAEFNGKRSVNYFTVWVKQSDGGWKWVYDGGASDAAAGLPPAAPVLELAVSRVRPISAQEAMLDVRAAERALADQAAASVSAAYLPHLAPEAWMQGSPRRPAKTPAEVSAELATRAPAIRFTMLGGGAARYGDMAWTYGAATWGDAGKGDYVRVWQRRPEGWRIVFDQLLDAAPKS